MFVKEILREKGHEVFTIDSSVTLATVVEELVARQCGSLVVIDRGQIVGIVTERDILHASAERRTPLAETKLCDAMKRNLTTASPTDKVSDLMGVMTDRRVRHLPVLDDGELIGLVSIGDVVKAQHAELQTENQFLKEYIHG